MAPASVFNRLQDYYYPKPEEDLPILSVKTAALLSIAYTTFYVLPFYLSKTTRPSPSLTRDAPTVIRARVQAVTIACTLCSCFTFWFFTTRAESTPLETCRLLGWWPISLPEVVKSVLLTCLLFAGPLFERGVVEGGWKDWVRCRGLADELSSWFGYRNYVVGPLTEELLFRSLIIPLHLLTPLARTSPGTLVLITPLYFGIAHIHHFYEFTLTHPHTPRLAAFLRSVFQFGFTTVFGWYASFLFVRTGSLLAVWIVHAFCNWMGLPRLWGRVDPPPPSTSSSAAFDDLLHTDTTVGQESVLGRTESEQRSKEDDDDYAGKSAGMKSKKPIAAASLSSSVLLWTASYYTILFAGAYGFYRGLWPLTESKAGAALMEF